MNKKEGYNLLNNAMECAYRSGKIINILRDVSDIKGNMSDTDIVVGIIASVITGLSNFNAEDSRCLADKIHNAVTYLSEIREDMGNK